MAPRGPLPVAKETDPRSSLKAQLQEEPILAAWLFGSAARDDMGPLSDVDVALLPRSGLDDRERLRVIGRIASAAQKAWGVGHADVVFVDEAPPDLAFEAVQGELLIDHDPDGRILKEARIASIYHDRRYYADRRRRLNSDRWRKGEFA